ncbi:MAG: hypothetical protein COA86_09525 [Kangiella sp.]|nr:MAG: hypothetical protein COA86_09525 [Kangiella sp.]
MTKINKQDRFWETIPFDQLDQKQWESLCDGCGQCCAHKLQDDETEEVFLTNVVCQYLDHQTCHCSVYENRHQYVPDCIKITPENAKTLNWIPETCAYRLVANGKPLPEWHPLVVGDRASTKQANMTILNKVISEEDVEMDDLEDYLVEDDYFSHLLVKIGAK